jgi:alpha-beta hydrolase superfamily lysophospholipase
MANFAPRSPAKINANPASRGPLLLTAGGQDHAVPPAIVKSTLRLYKHSSATTELREFPDRGHSLTIDSGWPHVAEAALSWLGSQSLLESVLKVVIGVVSWSMAGGRVEERGG